MKNQDGKSHKRNHTNKILPQSKWKEIDDNKKKFEELVKKITDEITRAEKEKVTTEEEKNLVSNQINIMNKMKELLASIHQMNEEVSTKELEIKNLGNDKSQNNGSKIHKNHKYKVLPQSDIIRNKELQEKITNLKELLEKAKKDLASSVSEFHELEKKLNKRK